ncbi:MAG TPA: hypothetical protein PLL88_02660 [Anaerolineaceae bacterium]|nr:hypothetical protein [Anaerolineaceae bacterium]
MKILIICAVGMSSSLVVDRMRKLAPEGTVIDYGIGMDTIKEIGDYDVLLIGPQLRYKKDQIVAAAEKEGIPYGFIDMVHYGRAMAQEIYDQALELHKGKK